MRECMYCGNMWPKDDVVITNHDVTCQECKAYFDSMEEQELDAQNHYEVDWEE